MGGWGFGLGVWAGGLGWGGLGGAGGAGGKRHNRIRLLCIASKLLAEQIENGPNCIHRTACIHNTHTSVYTHIGGGGIRKSLDRPHNGVYTLQTTINVYTDPPHNG